MRLSLFVCLLGILIFFEACNRNDCPGEYTADSPSLYPIQLYYFDKLSGDNILGYASPNYRESDFIITRYRFGDSVKLNSGNTFFVHTDKGQSFDISDYEAEFDSTIYTIGFLNYKLDTVIYYYDINTSYLTLSVNDSLIVHHDICDYWQTAEIYFYE